MFALQRGASGTIIMLDECLVTQVYKPKAALHFQAICTSGTFVRPTTGEPGRCAAGSAASQASTNSRAWPGPGILAMEMVDPIKFTLIMRTSRAVGSNMCGAHA